MSDIQPMPIPCPDPTNQDDGILYTNNFRLIIEKTPDVLFKIQNCSIPDITLSSIDIDSGFRSTPFEGTKISYGALTVTFIVNASLSNYSLLFNWIRALGYPDFYTQFNNFPERAKVWQRYELPDERIFPRNKLDIDSESYGRSDGSLFITSRATGNEVNAVVHFKDLFPINLSQIEFQSNNSEPTPAICTCNFAYDKFDLNLVPNISHLNEKLEARKHEEPKPKPKKEK